MMLKNLEKIVNTECLCHIINYNQQSEGFTKIFRHKHSEFTAVIVLLIQPTSLACYTNRFQDNLFSLVKDPGVMICLIVRLFILELKMFNVKK